MTNRAHKQKLRKEIGNLDLAEICKNLISDFDPKENMFRIEAPTMTKLPTRK